MESTTSELRQRLDQLETELVVEKEKYLVLKQELVGQSSAGQVRTPDDDDKKLLNIHIAELQVSGLKCEKATLFD